MDFNAHLAAQLQDMHRRRAPDSQFLFPSTKRGEGDAATVTLNKASTKVREMAGIPDFTCHLCRYFFFSFCVMARIDYMTIARWVAHKDGGVLIGKVYGHLTNEHAQRQAQKLVFGPTVVARYCSPFLETAFAFAQICLSSTAETKARFLGVHFNGRIFFVGSNLSTRRQWLC